MFFFFKQKAAYEMRISDWSSDVCSSDLPGETMKRMLAGLTKPPAGEEVDLMSLSANDGRGFVERMRAVDELPTWLSQEELDHYTAEFRSEERRVGKEGVSTCRTRWSPSHQQKTHTSTK